MGADSTEKYIVFNDSASFRLYDIEQLLTRGTPPTLINVDDLNFQIIVTDKMKLLQVDSWKQMELKEQENPDDEYVGEGEQAKDKS